MNKVKVRDSSYDIMKGVLIYLVILGHQIQFSGIEDPWHNHVFNFIYLFHMPLFIFISGVFAVNLGKKDFNSMVKGRFRRIMIPCIFYTILSLAIYFFSTPIWTINFSDKIELLQIIKDVVHKLLGFWFLYCVFALSLIYYPILKYIESKERKYLYVVISLSLLWILCILFEHTPIIAQINDLQIPRQTIVFGLGIIYGKYKDKLNKYVLPILFISLVLASINFYINGVWFGDYTLTQKIYNGIMCTIIMFITLMPLSKLLAKTRIGGGIQMCGIDSLGIYTIHCFLLPVVNFFNHSVLSACEIVVWSIITLLLSLCIIAVIKKTARSYSYIFGV